jgi:hypothetical protein
VNDAHVTIAAEGAPARSGNLRRVPAGAFLIALVAAACVVAVGVKFGSKSAAASDGYGYLSQAEMWRSGLPKIDQPWLNDVPWPNKEWNLMPLAWRPVGHERGWSMVPIGSTGLSLLMAAAKAIGGRCAPFVLGPLAGGILVLATYGIGSRLVSAAAGAIAAVLVATSPVVLYHVMWPMSDVPCAAAWACAFYFALDDRRGWLAASGTCAAIATLIRPNLAFGIAIIAVWVFLRLGDRRWRSLWFAAPAAVGPVLVAILNTLIYGSPTSSGYDGVNRIFMWENVGANAKLYATWLVTTHTPLILVGAVVAVWISAPIWPRASRGAVAALAIFAAGVSVEYFSFQVFDAWWFLRYFLPVWPLLMIGLAAVIYAIGRRSAAAALLCAVVTAGLGAHGIYQATTRKVFELGRADWRFAGAGSLVRGSTEDRSVVFSFLHSGTIRYYAGRFTLKFDYLDRDWLDRSVEWFQQKGIHVYALLEESEVEQFRSWFANQTTLDRLSYPVFEYRTDPTTIRLFDLSDPSPRQPMVVVERYDHMRCLPPVSLINPLAR